MVVVRFGKSSGRLFHADPSPSSPAERQEISCCDRQERFARKLLRLLEHPPILNGARSRQELTTHVRCSCVIVLLRILTRLSVAAAAAVAPYLTQSLIVSPTHWLTSVHGDSHDAKNRAR